ncbi:MAG: AbrB/MazE/SpoVT family DNA-binding domain-containing protein [Nanoarchaeota archaeon]
MTDKIEIATVSSRGQICIPNDIREEMGIKEGSKVLFALTGDSLIMKRVNMQTFAEVTKPFKEAAKKAGLKESDVPDMVHRFRAENRAKNKEQ